MCLKKHKPAAQRRSAHVLKSRSRRYQMMWAVFYLCNSVFMLCACPLICSRWPWTKTGVTHTDVAMTGCAPLKEDDSLYPQGVPEETPMVIRDMYLHIFHGSFITPGSWRAEVFPKIFSHSKLILSTLVMFLTLLQALPPHLVSKWTPCPLPPLSSVESDDWLQLLHPSSLIFNY